MRAEPPKIFGQRGAGHHGAGVPAAGGGVPHALAQRRALLGPLAWSSSGFIAGALFWHGIGFWSFVSGVVFNQDSDQGGIASWSKPQTVSEEAADVPDLSRGSLEISTKLCRELFRDAQTGLTAEQACSARWRPNIVIGYRGTRDLERSALTAKLTVPEVQNPDYQNKEIEIASDANHLATGTLTEADIDLYIAPAILPSR